MPNLTFDTNQIPPVTDLQKARPERLMKEYGTNRESYENELNAIKETLTKMDKTDPGKIKAEQNKLNDLIRKRREEGARINLLIDTNAEMSIVNMLATRDFTTEFTYEHLSPEISKMIKECEKDARMIKVKGAEIDLRCNGVINPNSPSLQSKVPPYQNHLWIVSIANYPELTDELSKTGFYAVESGQLAPDELKKMRSQTGQRLLVGPVPTLMSDGSYKIKITALTNAPNLSAKDKTIEADDCLEEYLDADGYICSRINTNKFKKYTDNFAYMHIEGVVEFFNQTKADVTYKVPREIANANAGQGIFLNALETMQARIYQADLSGYQLDQNEWPEFIKYKVAVVYDQAASQLYYFNRDSKEIKRLGIKDQAKLDSVLNDKKNLEKVENDKVEEYKLITDRPLTAIKEATTNFNPPKNLEQRALALQTQVSSILDALLNIKMSGKMKQGFVERYVIYDKLPANEKAWFKDIIAKVLAQDCYKNVQENFILEEGDVNDDKYDVVLGNNDDKVNQGQYAILDPSFTPQMEQKAQLSLLRVLSNHNPYILGLHFKHELSKDVLIEIDPSQKQVLEQQKVVSLDSNKNSFLNTLVQPKQEGVDEKPAINNVGTFSYRG